MVERHLALAARLAAHVDAAADLERLAEVPLDIVCFRFRPEGVDAEALDGLNRELGAKVLEDGRVYVGQTIHRGMVCFRPAIVNWLTTEADVDELVAVIRELGAILAPARDRD
jgi:glutamate/tyrosine decarboxylase-like PLP-dependent enzyme